MSEHAKQLIENREADHPANLLKARELLLAAEQNTEHAILLAEALFWLGEYASSDAEKEKFFGEGVEFGKKAVAKAAGDVRANLWYAANMGAHGLVRGIMSSLFYVGDIDKIGSKALDLDRTFFMGGPLRLMGRFYHQCPPWPIGKGDMTKAIKLLEEAVKVGPTYYQNHLYLADAYLARRKKDEAKKLLQQIIAATNAAFPLHHKRMVDEAKVLLAKT